MATPFVSGVISLLYLEKEVKVALEDFERILCNSQIVIPSEKFNKRDYYTHMF